MKKQESKKMKRGRGISLGQPETFQDTNDRGARRRRTARS